LKLLLGIPESFADLSSGTTRNSVVAWIPAMLPRQWDRFRKMPGDETVDRELARALRIDRTQRVQDGYLGAVKIGKAKDSFRTGQHFLGVLLFMASGLLIRWPMMSWNARGAAFGITWGPPALVNC
jgi:hypothetical protein